MSVLLIAAVGERIAHYRNNRGWSQQRLANAIGTTQNNISRWESGARTINIASLADIAAALHIPITSFFPDTEPPPELSTFTLQTIADQLETITATLRDHTQ